MKSGLFTIFIILILVGCHARSSLRKYASVLQPKLSYDTSRQTIIAYDKAGHFFDDYGYTIGNFNQQDLKTIDSLLIEAVLSHNNEQNEQKLPHRMIDFVSGKYREQLVALTGTTKRTGKVKGMNVTWGRKGVNYAWVNCFCSRSRKVDKYWKTEIISVDDGGPCFFNLMIDLTNKKYFDMDVNGR